MTRQRCSHGPTHLGSRPSQSEIGLMRFSQHYRQKYSSVSSAVLLAGLRRSCRWRSLMWRSWAGVVTQSVIVRRVGLTAKFSKMTSEVAYGREINMKYSGNSSGEHSCRQHTNCTLPQLETSVALCCDKTAHFRVVFYCPQHKVHLWTDHVV
jgi:hypothetical protein